MTKDRSGETSRLKPLRLSEMLDRYRIEEPIDEAADREKWQDIAARDVFGTDHQCDNT